MGGPIVCGVDGSERGARALSTASWLADRMGASLVAVHVIPKPSKRAARAFGSLTHASDAAKERGNRVLARALDRPDLQKSVGRLVEVGNPAESLISAARDQQAALVVAGSRGGGPLRNALLGSTSQRLVRSCHLPVVIVPREPDPPDREREARSLVCGVDSSEQSDRAVAVAGDLAHTLDLCLVLVHVYQPAISQAAIPASSGILPVDAERLAMKAKREGGDALARAEGLVSAKLQVQPNLVAGDPGTTLVELAGREHAAMIVVGSRGSRPLKAALTGSTSSAVLGAADVPVAIVTGKTAAGGPPHPSGESGTARRSDSTVSSNRSEHTTGGLTHGQADGRRQQAASPGGARGTQQAGKDVPRPLRGKGRRKDVDVPPKP